MVSPKSNPERREHRALHSAIAICLLILAQLNLLLHHDEEAPDVAKKQKEIVKREVTAPRPSAQIPAKNFAGDQSPAIAISTPVNNSPALPERGSTAFSAMREGNQYVSERSQGKIVQIISSKTEDGLNPSDWRVVYYDPEAKFKAVEVQFAHGEMAKVSRPGRFFELFWRRTREPIGEDLLKIDSDEALAIALRRTGLTDRTAEKSEFKLETGSDGMPIWRINFWGRVQSRETPLGEVVISAHDGRLVQNRLKAALVPDQLSAANSKVFPEKRL